MTFGKPFRCSQNNRGAQITAMNTARKKGTRREPASLIPATTMIKLARITNAGILAVRFSALSMMCPIPGVPHVYPIAVMMGDITKGFCRNPGLVPVPVGLAFQGKEGPAYNDSWPPEPALRPFIGVSFPPSILFEGKRLVLKAGWKVFDRAAPHPGFGLPKVFPGRVPPVPAGIDSTLV
jgi:hypothetical protein